MCSAIDDNFVTGIYLLVNSLQERLYKKYDLRIPSNAKTAPAFVRKCANVLYNAILYTFNLNYT